MVDVLRLLERKGRARKDMYQETWLALKRKWADAEGLGVCFHRPSTG